MSDENQTQTVTKTPLEEAKAKAEALFINIQTNVDKFLVKGTASAAARARKSISELTKFNKSFRKELQLAKVAKVAEKRAAKAAAKAAATPAA